MEKAAVECSSHKAWQSVEAEDEIFGPVITSPPVGALDCKPLFDPRVCIKNYFKPA